MLLSEHLLHFFLFLLSLDKSIKVKIFATNIHKSNRNFDFFLEFYRLIEKIHHELKVVESTIIS